MLQVIIVWSQPMIQGLYYKGWFADEDKEDISMAGSLLILILTGVFLCTQWYIGMILDYSQIFFEYGYTFSHQVYFSMLFVCMFHLFTMHVKNIFREE